MHCASASTAPEAAEKVLDPIMEEQEVNSSPVGQDNPGNGAVDNQMAVDDDTTKKPEKPLSWAEEVEEQAKLEAERKAHNKAKQDKLKELRKQNRSRFIDLVFPTTRVYADWINATGANGSDELDEQVTKIWQFSPRTK